MRFSFVSNLAVFANVFTPIIAAPKCLSGLWCCPGGSSDDEHDYSNTHVTPAPPGIPLQVLPPANPPAPDPQRPWDPCPNHPPPGQKWACQEDSVSFPTVSCLMADIATCGRLNAGGAEFVFYSFGASTVESRQRLADTLDPRGIMFNDGLLGDKDFFEKVMKRFKEIGDPGSRSRNHLSMNRADVFTARYAEAIARLTKGATYVVVRDRDGRGNQLAHSKQKPVTGYGAYQIPYISPDRPKSDPPPIPNYWLTYEFPALQRNKNVLQVSSVDLNNNMHQQIDWVNPDQQGTGPGHGAPLLPEGNADSIEVPPPQGFPGPYVPPPSFLRNRRSLCGSWNGASPDGSAGAYTAASTGLKRPMTTAPPTPSCSVQDGDPTDFQNEHPACVCSEGASTVTVTQLPTTAGASNGALCAYTTLPSGPGLPAPSLPVITSNCQVCTQLNINEANCNTIASCTPTSISTSPSTTASTSSSSMTAIADTIVQVSQNSIHVGNLPNQSFYNDVWNVIRPICPDPASGKNASCTANKVSINDVETIVGVTNTMGMLSFTVDDSQYSSVGQRDAMLGAGITAFVNSATGKNCHATPWSATAAICPKGSTKEKRFVQPPANLCEGTTVLCNAANLITVEFNLPGQPEAAYLNIAISWELESGDSAFAEFACDLTIDAVEAALAAAAPEVAAADWRALGELRGCCTDNGDCMGVNLSDPAQGTGG